jgi:hypothetical protein
MGSFKVGDRVRCIQRPSDNAGRRSLLRKTGTVEQVNHAASVVVSWDDWHDGWGADESKWTVMNDEVQLIANSSSSSSGLFKAGDKVIIKESGNEHYGETATVISDDGDRGIFPVKVRRQDGGTEPFARRNLERASEAGLYVVIVEKEGKLAPATTPKVYGTYRQANNVADDMAKRHGGKFLVFRATYESISTVTSRSL